MIAPETSLSFQRRSAASRRRWENPIFRAETGQKISEALADTSVRQARSRQTTELWTDPAYRRQLSPIIQAAFPLMLRGGTNEEIARICELSLGSIQDCWRRVRKNRALAQNLPEANRSEAVSRARYVAEVLKDPSRQGEITHSENFARRIHNMGLVDKSVEFWQLMKGLYHYSQRSLPLLLSDQLRLELFTAGFAAIYQRDKQSLNLYARLGEEEDAEWFGLLRGEERFIIDSIRQCKSNLIAIA